MEQATLVRRTVKEAGAYSREGLMPPPVLPPRDTALASFHADLSEDDLQLLAVISKGVTTEVAARSLEISARTLRRRLRGVCDELGVNTPIEAVVWAARRHLV